MVSMLRTSAPGRAPSGPSGYGVGESILFRVVAHDLQRRLPDPSMS